ncbi:DHS-like NAD/FAD-binding domain-containing protein [Panus rudis PR-1116 ss-1]|nr:DHS-like NAD/FAD-binding domain-containing protein [Panus rudis PR-1116 ss-1]
MADTRQPPSSDIHEFRSALRASRNVVAIVGAGLSAASDPSIVWKHPHTMRAMALHAIPNSAHFALSLLCICIPTFWSTIAPFANFTLVTQNIDGLSTRALEISAEQYNVKWLGTTTSDSEISKIYEMHGRVLDTLCTSCGHREHNTSSPLCHALASTTPDQQVPIEELPRGGLLRAGVVWFEEIPHHSREIWDAVDKADLSLLIGMSSTIQPAAGYAYYEVKDHGGKVAVLNKERTDGDSERGFLFLGPCEETLPSVLFDIESKE